MAATEGRVAGQQLLCMSQAARNNIGASQPGHKLAAAGFAAAAAEFCKRVPSVGFGAHGVRLSAAAACRTGVLSTISAHPSSAGFPFGSVVEFAVDDSGYPLLSTSTLSPHTADLQADGRCSITVTAPGFTVSNVSRHATAQNTAMWGSWTGAAHVVM